MNKSESKYFNTALRFNKALLSLLERKEFAYITIREICQEAGVNRSTFYLHYENTSDLLKETTQYVLDTFLSYFPVDSQKIAHRFQECSLKELLFITPEYLTPYLTFIQENQRIFSTSIRQFGTMNFQNVYEKMSLHIFDPILSRFDIPESNRPYVMKFYLAGITAIVMQWIQNNCKESIDQMSSIIMDCVMGKIYASL